MELLPIIIDLILIWVLIGCILDGRKKGFVKMILSIVATVISLFVAKEFAEPVAIWVEETFIRNAAINSISNSLSFHIDDTAQEAINALPDYIHNAAKFAGIEMESFISGVITLETVETSTSAIYTAVKDFAIIPAAKIVAFFIIFAISNAVLGILIGVINAVAKLPVLKSLNKLLGGVLGFIKGGIAVYIVSAVFGFVAMIAPDNAFSQAVSETTLQQSFWEVIISMFNQ